MVLSHPYSLQKIPIISEAFGHIRHGPSRPPTIKSTATMQPPCPFSDSTEYTIALSSSPPLSHKKRSLDTTPIPEQRKRRATSSINGETIPSAAMDLLDESKTQIINEVACLPDSPDVISLSQPSSSSSAAASPQTVSEHVIELSSVEHCMPRAYIRVCLAYRMPDPLQVPAVVRRLNEFIRNKVDAKPYLAGFIVPRNPDISTGPVEIRFTTADYEQYPAVEVCDLLDDDDQKMDYDMMDAAGLPPSMLNPEKIAQLPAPLADEQQAPVFRTRANLVKGGIIISLYLHHCISDGTGLGLLVNGDFLPDSFMFERHASNDLGTGMSLERRLSEFANMKSIQRKQLSWSDPNQVSSTRQLSYNHLDVNGGRRPVNSPGRGCIFSFPDSRIEALREVLCHHSSIDGLSRHDVLQALIWRHMSQARLPTVRDNPKVTKSKLLIPVNIRNKISQPLPESYFGAAVDFASAELELETLTEDGDISLATAAKTIRDAIRAVDEPYIRQAIALARDSDPNVDVRDLLASNIDRVSGADLYITSWERLGLYDATLDMGLGTPDWVRKPWSRDPGSCIVLPRNPHKKQFEVVVQMAASDMERLLLDQEFNRFVTRVIE